jgi:PAS domain S-box-containing protein
VSSLLKNHQYKISCIAEKNCEKLACWELLSCPRVLCPAYGRDNVDCWHIPQTLCMEQPEEDFYQKISTCLTCSYFQKRGKKHPGGWDDFLASQIHRYIYNALEKIYQKEESFVEILNRIPDGLFTTDKELRITYFNPAAEKITGFPATDAVGMYCKDVFKNKICETDCALKRACEIVGDIHNREYVITNIEGREIPIMCSTTAFRDASGKIIGGLEIFKDITEIHRLQDEIAKSERKFRRVFEGSHDMIYTTNKKGKILEINDAGVELLGFMDKEEVLNLDHARKLYHKPKDRDRFIRQVDSEGFAKDFEVDFVKKNGSLIRVLISSRKYENPITGETEFEGIIKDITKRKQAEEIIRQRNLELSVMNSVAVAINLTMDMQHILDVTLKNVVRSLKIKRGGVFLIDHNTRSIKLEASLGLPLQDSNASEGAIFKDKELRKHLLNPGGLLAPEPTFPFFKAKYKAVDGQKVPWLTCILITFKGKSIGFFGLDIHFNRILSDHEFRYLGSLGNFLGGAIANSQFMKAISLHQQELSRLTQMLFFSQEEERRRIARELHDEAGQALTAVTLSLDRLEQHVAGNPEKLIAEITQIRKLVQRTSSEIRGLSYRLHPTLLVDLGLEPALNLYFREMATRSDLDIDFRMVGFDKRLKPDIETVFYRFSQEALTNALKHSGAETFKISIIKSYPKIIFTAEDDGVGFDGQIGGNDKRSLGLIGMRERAIQLGGTFTLLGRPGLGVRIRVEIPFEEAVQNDRDH